MYRIHQIKLRPGEPESHLKEKILKRIGRKDILITDIHIVRKSIDARRKDDIFWVYSVDFQAGYKKRPEETARLSTGGKGGVEISPELSFHMPLSGDQPLEERPVIAGFGPCGMFAALILAEAGYRPMVLERGKDADSRAEDVARFWNEGKLDPESNVQFGEGGAGTFSDGKLTTGIRDVRIRKVLEELVEAGAPEDILYLAKPHIGTDILRRVVKNIRGKVIGLGGDVMFCSRLERLEIEDGRLTAVGVVREGREEVIRASELILATGHSARDTFRMLRDAGIAMEQKPFSIGVRIEHSQELIDMAQYGRLSRGYADHRGESTDLLPADYKLSRRLENGRGVYTFCMCPGGKVVMAASEKESVVTNGMSESRRDSGTANSALLVDVRTEDFGSDDVLAGVEFQRRWEHAAFKMGGRCENRAPQTYWRDFRDNTDKGSPVIESLPDFAVEAIREAVPIFGRKLKGFDSDDALLTAVESRSSSPVRILRDENMECSVAGIRPCGEGAGHAGGIMSAACDGIKAAEKIISKYAKPKI